MDFSVNVDRSEIIKGEYLKITFDINIDKGFFIYSTDENLSLSPTKIIWPDSTIFSDSSIFFAPNPKIKFDDNFDM